MDLYSKLSCFLVFADCSIALEPNKMYAGVSKFICQSRLYSVESVVMASGKKRRTESVGGTSLLAVITKKSSI